MSKRNNVERTEIVSDIRSKLTGLFAGILSTFLSERILAIIEDDIAYIVSQTSGTLWSITSVPASFLNQLFRTVAFLVAFLFIWAVLWLHIIPAFARYNEQIQRQHSRHVTSKSYKEFILLSFGDISQISKNARSDEVYDNYLALEAILNLICKLEDYTFKNGEVRRVLRTNTEYSIIKFSNMHASDYQVAYLLSAIIDSCKILKSKEELKQIDLCLNDILSAAQTANKILVAIGRKEISLD